MGYTEILRHSIQLLENVSQKIANNGKSCAQTASCIFKLLALTFLMSPLASIAICRTSLMASDSRKINVLPSRTEQTPNMESFKMLKMFKSVRKAANEWALLRLCAAHSDRTSPRQSLRAQDASESTSFGLNTATHSQTRLICRPVQYDICAS